MKKNDQAARPIGRPPASVQRQPEVPAEIPQPVDERHVPALLCPKCGAFMRPHVERWETGGYASCVCTAPAWRLNRSEACRFTYRPPLVRVKTV